MSLTTDVDIVARRRNVSPFQGLRYGGDPNPGRRCALPWAVMFCPFGAKIRRPGRPEGAVTYQPGVTPSSLILVGSPQATCCHRFAVTLLAHILGTLSWK